MAGYDLKEGEYDNRSVSEDELWAALANLFTSKSRNDSSYKYGFLKAILNNMETIDHNYILSFDQLFLSFTEVYWDLILKHHLRQKTATNDNRKSSIEIIISEAQCMFCDEVYIPFSTLSNQAKRSVSHKVKMNCKRYVVGAVFEDTKRLFYSFSKTEEWIKLNPMMYRFICRRKEDIERLNYYEWSFFLEKTNPGLSADKILTKALLQKGDRLQTGKLGEQMKIEETNPSSSLLEERIEPISFNPRQEYVDEIDEEVKAVIDDPIALISLLRKRKGI